MRTNHPHQHMIITCYQFNHHIRRNRICGTHHSHQHIHRATRTTAGIHQQGINMALIQASLAEVILVVWSAQSFNNKCWLAKVLVFH